MQEGITAFTLRALVALETMERRKFVFLALAGASGSLVGCDADQRPSPTATLISNGEIQEALKTLADAIANLNGDVDDFDTENWRDVVPRVKNSATDVSDSFEKLKTALGIER